MYYYYIVVVVVVLAVVVVGAGVAVEVAEVADEEVEEVLGAEASGK